MFTNHLKLLFRKAIIAIIAKAIDRKGLTPTFTCCINAEGEFILLTKIFKHKRMNYYFRKEAPLSNRFGCFLNRWVMSEQFVQWLSTFYQVHKVGEV